MINFVVLQFEDDSDEENAVVSQVLDELGVEMAGSVRALAPSAPSVVVQTCDSIVGLCVLCTSW